MPQVTTSWVRLPRGVMGAGRDGEAGGVIVNVRTGAGVYGKVHGGAGVNGHGQVNFAGHGLTAAIQLPVDRAAIHQHVDGDAVALRAVADVALDAERPPTGQTQRRTDHAARPSITPGCCSSAVTPRYGAGPVHCFLKSVTSYFGRGWKRVRASPVPVAILPAILALCVREVSARIGQHDARGDRRRGRQCHIPAQVDRRIGQRQPERTMIRRDRSGRRPSGPSPLVRPEDFTASVAGASPRGPGPGLAGPGTGPSRPPAPRVRAGGPAPPRAAGPSRHRRRKPAWGRICQGDRVRRAPAPSWRTGHSPGTGTRRLSERPPPAAARSRARQTSPASARQW